MKSNQRNKTYFPDSSRTNTYIQLHTCNYIYPSVNAEFKALLEDNKTLACWKVWILQKRHMSLINWRTLSRRVTRRWWRQWAKNQVLTNQNTRNRWCHIVRSTVYLICFLVCSILPFFLLVKSEFPKISSNLLNLMVVLTFPVLNWKHSSWANLVCKIKVCQFKLKFGTNINSNMLNLMMFFCSILGKFGPKNKKSSG